MLKSSLLAAGCELPLLPIACSSSTTSRHSELDDSWSIEADESRVARASNFSAASARLPCGCFVEASAISTESVRVSAAMSRSTTCFVSRIRESSWASVFSDAADIIALGDGDTSVAPRARMNCNCCDGAICCCCCCCWACCSFMRSTRDRATDCSARNTGTGTLSDRDRPSSISEIEAADAVGVVALGGTCAEAVASVAVGGTGAGGAEGFRDPASIAAVSNSGTP